MRRFRGVIVAFLLVAALLVFYGGNRTTSSVLSAATPQAVDMGTQPAELATDAPASGGAPVLGTQVPQTAVPGSRINPPMTLADLLKQYPDLQPYLDKIKDTKVGDMDFTEFYATVAKLYSEKGASGVAIFLQSSGLLEKLGIPISYLDLLNLYEKGGMDAVIKEAQKRGIITSKNELDGFLTIDTPDNLASVKDALKVLGISAYDFDTEANELEIGIPLELVQQFQTPSALIKFLVQVATVPHVTKFRAPAPPVDVTKSS